MILAIDAGNEQIKVGGFKQGKLQFVCHMAADVHLTGDQYAVQLKELFRLYETDISAVEGAILSSVVPRLSLPLTQAVSRLAGCRVLTVGPGIKTGLNIKIDNIVSMGTDLVCGAVGALSLYRPPLAVFDFGTATTLTVLDAQGILCGKMILPGVQMGLDALSEHTASLPSICLQTPASFLGKNTVEALQSGAVYGAAAMLDGLYTRCRDIFGDSLSCVLTGGNSAAIAPFCKTKTLLEPNLVLLGLSIIYAKNRCDL